MAAAWRRGYLPSAALCAIVAAYLIGTVLPTYGHPLYPFFEVIITSLRENHPHIDHAISEKEFAALILTWLAAYLFVISARWTTGHQSDALSTRPTFPADE